MDAIKRKISKKKWLHTYSRYTVYVNINIYIYIYIYLCVCLYDLAMPICIILDPLEPLIHIEGRRWTGTCWSSWGCAAWRRHWAKQPAGAWGKFGTTAPTVPGPRAWPATCGLCWQSCKSRPGSAAGARDEHEPHHLIIRSRQLASSI